ncbi:MAG: hypothetical protein ACE14L_10055 [Terriglobales bacterium]
MVHKLLAVFISAVLVVTQVGCKCSVGGSIQVGPGTVKGEIHAACTNVAPTELQGYASGTSLSIYDMPAYVVVRDPSDNPTLTITAKTDTGLQATQTFPLVEADASQIPAGVPGTQTFAFKPQNPTALNDWVKWIANNTMASAEIEIKTTAGFIDVASYGDNTVYFRTYNPTEGYVNRGSATYSVRNP